MPDSFVHFKGIKKYSEPDPQATQPNPSGFYSHGFICRYSSQEDLSQACYHAMEEITDMQGMVVIRDETLPNAPSNLMFIPMHMMSRIEIDIKPMIGAYPMDPVLAVKQ